MLFATHSRDHGPWPHLRLSASVFHLSLAGLFMLWTVLKAEPPSNAPGRKFIDLTARERLAILAQIKTMDPEELFQLFLHAGRVEKDAMKQSMLQGRFTMALQAGPLPPAFLEKMRQFVLDPAHSTLERGLLTSAFASARTEQTTELLLWAVSHQTDAELKHGAIANIGGLGGAQPYLPPMLEPLWRQPQDPPMLKNVALALAREAAPSSIELLFSAAILPDGVDDDRRAAAFYGLLKVYRASAVPPLAAALQKAPPRSPSRAQALQTLSQIGDKSAAQAIIGWLQTTDSSASSLVPGWLNRAGSAAHRKAAQDALNPAVPFRSEEIREAIRAMLAAQRTGSIIRNGSR